MSGLRELYLCVLCRTEFSFEFDCSLGIGEFRMHLNVFFFYFLKNMIKISMSIVRSMWKVVEAILKSSSGS